MRTGRRRVLAMLGGALVGALPRPSWARQPRTIGFLFGLANDHEAQMRIKAFEEGLKKEGLVPGRDIRIEYRFAEGDAARMRALARELIALKPDLLVGHSTPVVRALGQATHTIPIVFVVVADPVGSGFAASISHPGRNITGFTNLNATITGKLLTILKQIAPSLSRAAAMFNPDTVTRSGLLSLYLDPFQAAASALTVKPIIAEVRSIAEIERCFSDFGREPGTGLIVMPDNFTTVNRQLIIELAARWRIPTIYPYRYFAEAGGLVSYGVDVTDLFRRAANYVRRILSGANVSELPIQAPTKFELVINIKTANTLGLTVPKVLLAGADDVIQ